MAPLRHAAEFGGKAEIICSHGAFPVLTISDIGLSFGTFFFECSDPWIRDTVSKHNAAR
jgi:hypothetical protein